MDSTQLRLPEIIAAHYIFATRGLEEATLADGAAWYRYVSDLPRLEQAVYVISTFHQQVYNGGLHQYFLNAYGQFAFLAADYLRAISASRSAGILESAIAAVKDQGLSNAEFVRLVGSRQLARINDFDDTLFDLLNALDDTYYSLESDPSEDLVILLGNYIQRG